MHAGAESVPGPAQASVTALAAEQSAVMDEIDVLMEELVADTVLQNVQPELQVRLPGVETYHGEPEHQCHVSYRTMHPCLVISRTSDVLRILQVAASAGQEVAGAALDIVAPAQQVNADREISTWYIVTRRAYA